MHRKPTFPVVLAGFSAFLGLYATQPLLPLLARLFRATTFAVSLTVTASTMAVAVAAPLAGRLGDTFGRRRIIILAAFALSAATLLASSSRGLRDLILWRFVQGLATPGIFAVTIAYMHEQWTASRVGSVSAAYVSGTVAGGFAGRAIAGVVAAETSWRVAFVVLGVLNVVAAVALWMWLPREHAHERSSRRRIARPGSIGAHLTNRELLMTYAVGFCVLFTLVAMFTYVTFQLAAPPFGLSSAALGSLFVVYLIGAIITPLAGRWIDVYGHRPALTAAMAMSAFGSSLTLMHSLAVVILGLALCCSGAFIAQATATSHVGAAADHDRGVAVGLYVTFYYAGGSVGGAAPAWFWNKGGWPACVALVIAVQLTTMAIGWLFWRDLAGHRDEPLVVESV